MTGLLTSSSKTCYGYAMPVKAEIRKYEYYHSPSYLQGKVKTIETAGAGLKASRVTPRGRRRRRRVRKKVMDLG